MALIQSASGNIPDRITTDFQVTAAGMSVLSQQTESTIYQLNGAYFKEIIISVKNGKDNLKKLVKKNEHIAPYKVAQYPGTPYSPGAVVSETGKSVIWKGREAFSYSYRVKDETGAVYEGVVYVNPDTAAPYYLEAELTQSTDSRINSMTFSALYSSNPSELGCIEYVETTGKGKYLLTPYQFAGTFSIVYGQ